MSKTPDHDKSPKSGHYADPSEKGWLGLRDIADAGFRSAVEPESDGFPAVGSVVTKFYSEMRRRIRDVTVPKKWPQEQAPFFQEWHDGFDARRKAMQENEDALLKSTLVNIDEGDRPRVSVEALAMMVEEGFLTAPEKAATKTWTKDELRTPKSTEEPSPSEPRRR